MLFGKKEKELKDLLEIYKEQNRKLKSDLNNMTEMFETEKQLNMFLQEIAGSEFSEKFHIVIGITKDKFMPIVYVDGIKVPAMHSLNVEYKAGECPKVQIKYDVLG